MLKPELHEFLIANGGEYKKDAYYFNNFIIANLWGKIKNDLPIFAIKDGFGVLPISKGWPGNPETNESLISLLKAEDLTLDILKETLINAGIEVKCQHEILIENKCVNCGIKLSSNPLQLDDPMLKYLKAFNFLPFKADTMFSAKFFACCKATCATPG